jgi:hypothetical protein
VTDATHRAPDACCGQLELQRPSAPLALCAPGVRLGLELGLKATWDWLLALPLGRLILYNIYYYGVTSYDLYNEHKPYNKPCFFDTSLLPPLGSPDVAASGALVIN